MDLPEIWNNVRSHLTLSILIYSDHISRIPKIIGALQKENIL